jgi:hypothetical protein
MTTMKNVWISLLCASALFGGASCAFAGAYGEEGDVVETPAAPAAPAAVQTEVKKEADYAKLGPYFGAGALLGLESFAEHDSVSALTDPRTGQPFILPIEDVNVSNGYYARAGYRFLPWLAAEGLWERYNEFDIDPIGHFEAWSATANAKAIYGEANLQPYLVAGLGVLSGKQSFRNEACLNGKAKCIRDVNPPQAPVYPTNESSDSDLEFMIRVGVGVDVYLAEFLSLDVEAAYNVPFGDLDDFRYIGLSAGLTYHL